MGIQRRGRRDRSRPVLVSSGLVLLSAVLFVSIVGGARAAEGEAPAPAAETPAAKPAAKPATPKRAAAAKPSEPKRMPPPRHKVSADSPARFPADI